MNGTAAAAHCPPPPPLRHRTPRLSRNISLYNAFFFSSISHSLQNLKAPSHSREVYVRKYVFYFKIDIVIASNIAYQ